jgi:hypothetical protein
MVNLGQGVAWDDDIGRGIRRNHPEDYAEYVRGSDLASFDIYPVAHDSPVVAGKLWFVSARGRAFEQMGLSAAVLRSAAGGWWGSGAKARAPLKELLAAPGRKSSTPLHSSAARGTAPPARASIPHRSTVSNRRRHATLAP